MMMMMMMTTTTMTMTSSSSSLSSSSSSLSSSSSNQASTRQLVTVCSHLLLPQQHIYNGLTRRPDYSIFAREWTSPPVELEAEIDWPSRTACWPTAIVTGGTYIRTEKECNAADNGTARRTSWKHNASVAGKNIKVWGPGPSGVTYQVGTPGHHD